MKGWIRWMLAFLSLKARKDEGMEWIRWMLAFLSLSRNEWDGCWGFSSSKLDLENEWRES